MQKYYAYATLAIYAMHCNRSTHSSTNKSNEVKRFNQNQTETQNPNQTNCSKARPACFGRREREREKERAMSHLSITGKPLNKILACTLKTISPTPSLPPHSLLSYKYRWNTLYTYTYACITSVLIISSSCCCSCCICSSALTASWVHSLSLSLYYCFIIILGSCSRQAVVVVGLC